LKRVQTKYRHTNLIIEGVQRNVMMMMMMMMMMMVVVVVVVVVCEW
jgi:hypothetical protein